MKFILIISMLIALTLNVSCRDSGGGGSSSRDTNEAATIMNQAATAIASVMGAGGSSLQAASFMAANDFTCDENGTPDLVSNGTALQPGTNTNWAAAKIYCLIEKNSYSPETIQGSIALTRGILCALGDLTYNDVTVSKTITVSTDCFDQSMIDEMGNISFNLDVTPSAPGGNWDYQIIMDDPTNSVFNDAMTMKLKDSGGIKAAVMSEPDATDAKYGAWGVTIDQTNGKIWFESMDHRLTRTDGETQYNRHARVFVTGTLTSDYTFTSITDVQAIYSNYSLSGGRYYSKIATAKGNDTDGFKTRTYADNDGSVTASDSDTQAAYQNNGSDVFDVAGCYGGVCTGNDGIQFTDGNFDFILLDSVADTYPTGTWFSSIAAYLDFDPVTIAITNP